jgi:flagellar motor switch/type III secretory pathway protein FliN
MENTENQKIILTNEELQEIKGLQGDGLRLSQTLGSLEMSLQDILLKKEESIEELKRLRSKEVTILENIKAKYGEGSINIDTGEFVKL